MNKTINNLGSALRNTPYIKQNVTVEVSANKAAMGVRTNIIITRTTKQNDIFNLLCNKIKRGKE
jgi:hypothetical protein